MNKWTSDERIQLIHLHISSGTCANEKLLAIKLTNDVKVQSIITGVDSATQSLPQYNILYVYVATFQIHKCISLLVLN